MDDTKGQFLLSLRPSDLKLSLTLNEQEAKDKLLSSFLDFLEERNTLLSDLASTKVTSSFPREGSLSELAKSYCPGGHVSGLVTSVAGDHVTMEMEEGVMCKANLRTANGTYNVCAFCMTPSTCVPLSVCVYLSLKHTSTDFLLQLLITISHSSLIIHVRV